MKRRAPLLKPSIEGIASQSTEHISKKRRGKNTAVESTVGNETKRQVTYRQCTTYIGGESTRTRVNDIFSQRASEQRVMRVSSATSYVNELIRERGGMLRSLGE